MENITDKIYNKVLQIAETTAKHQTKLENIDEHLRILNGSVTKNSKEIVTIKSIIKYNKGIIVGTMGVISAFWAVISYLK